MRYLLTAVLLSMALTSPSQAQKYPTNNVRIIVPYVAGGGPDLLARQIANVLSRSWKQAIVVENRPGAGTLLGATEVARSAPDGHTILFTSDSTMSINPFIFKKLPYDPEKDFIAVGGLVRFYAMLLAHPSLPANTVSELIAYAKANPGKVSYASYGPGSPPHFAGEVLKKNAGVDIIHVPYKGAGDAVPATIGGAVQLTFAAMASGLPAIKGGLLKALAIGGDHRSSLLPNVPTFTEAGYPAVNTEVWVGTFVPARTPAEIVERINKDFAMVFADPAFQEKFLRPLDYEILKMPPSEFAKFVREDREKRHQEANIAGIQPQ